MKDREGGDRIPVSGYQRDALSPDAGLTRHVEAFPYTVNSWFPLQILRAIEVETYYWETLVKNVPSRLGCNAECPPSGERSQLRQGLR